MIKFTDPRAFKQFQELGQYLARTPPDKRPALSRIIKSLHPEVQQAVKVSLAAMDAAAHGGTTVPFGPRFSKDQVADALQIDPKLAKQVHQEEFDRSIAVGLQERMGTDADAARRRGPEDLTLHDHLEAAYDLHIGGSAPSDSAEKSSAPAGSVRAAIEAAASKY